MSDTVQVTFADRDPAVAERVATMPRGATVLDAARRAGIAIEANCGGRGRCRTCRIKVVKGEVSPPTIQDTVQLGHDEVREHFRLSCQSRLIEDCTVTAMPPRAEAGHQILTAETSVADDGRVHLDCGVARHVVTAKAPTDEHHQTSDLEEILAVLPDGTDTTVPINVLRKLPGVLRKSGGNLAVTTFNGAIIDVEAGDSAGQIYGMAFDIGTTTIVGTLMDLQTGEQLADVGGVNPQAVYGGDLMSRIAYAQFDDKKLATLRATALNAINGYIREACENAGVAADHVYKIVVVGNTCMHHIFAGIDVTYVGLAPYAPAVRDPLVFQAADLPLKAAPNARVCLLPIVAGFVGADTMACVLATRIYESEEIRALVDIGTNGEVVMGSKDRLLACSAPAGPALEGAQIRHGMRGAMGAIERVSIDDDIACMTIGDAPPIGICGSGLIDACAKLVDAGVVEPSGRMRRQDRDALPDALGKRFRDTPDGCEFVLVDEAESGKSDAITLSQADIRQLQLAKGAILSGIHMLRDVMGITNEDLEELMLCGGFGNYINIESSVKIRLLPDMPTERITYFGNAALMGAQMALLSETERDRSFDLARRIEHVALATRPEFQDLFVDAMRFMGESPAKGKKRRTAKAPRKTAAGGD